MRREAHINVTDYTDCNLFNFSTNRKRREIAQPYKKCWFSTLLPLNRLISDLQIAHKKRPLALMLNAFIAYGSTQWMPKSHNPNENVATNNAGFVCIEWVVCHAIRTNKSWPSPHNIRTHLPLVALLFTLQSLTPWLRIAKCVTKRSALKQKRTRQRLKYGNYSCGFCLSKVFHETMKTFYKTKTNCFGRIYRIHRIIFALISFGARESFCIYSLVMAPGVMRVHLGHNTGCVAASS